MVMTSGWRGKGRVYISEPATTSLPSRVAPSAPYNSEHYAQTARHPSPANPAQLAHLAPQPSSPVAHNALHTATPPESGHKIAQTPHLNCGGPCTSASPHAPLHLRGQSSLLNPADLAYKPPPPPFTLGARHAKNENTLQDANLYRSRSSSGSSSSSSSSCSGSKKILALPVLPLSARCSCSPTFWW